MQDGVFKLAPLTIRPRSDALQHLQSLGEMRDGLSHGGAGERLLRHAGPPLAAETSGPLDDPEAAAQALFDNLRAVP